MISQLFKRDPKQKKMPMSSVPHLPIQFAFPDVKRVDWDDRRQKKACFAEQSCSSGRQHYRFDCEEAYYQHYQNAYFAVTSKKAGWDCLRHYEIVAAGCIPYFLGIEECPQNTLSRWPKALLERALHFPGLPPLKKIVKYNQKNSLSTLPVSWNLFDLDQYYLLRQEWLHYFNKNLTTHALAEYFLQHIGHPTHIVFCFGISRGGLLDYMRDMLLIGLAQNTTIKLSVYPNPVWLLDTCPQQMTVDLYGRGFTTTRCLSPTAYDPLSLSQLRELLSSSCQRTAVVATTSSNQGFDALPIESQCLLNNRNDVVWVDGCDIGGDHDIPSCARMVFRREW